MLSSASISLDQGGFDQARQLAEDLALKGNPESVLISWADRDHGLHSPSQVTCEIHGRPGWEVYGENHGGRLRISVNDDQYVFIYS